MNICAGVAFIDDCGVCSEGTSGIFLPFPSSIGHRANSDKDCDGVCFGSHTEGCPAIIQVSQSVLDFSMGVVDNNFTDSAILSFQSLSLVFISTLSLGSNNILFNSQEPIALNPGVYPSLSISYFIKNQTHRIPIILSKYIIPPQSFFYAIITASSKELVSKPVIDLKHRKQFKLKVDLYHVMTYSYPLYLKLTILMKVAQYL